MRILNLVLCLLLTANVFAQTGKPESFFVPRLPPAILKDHPKILYSINNEIATLKDSRLVYIVLDRYLHDYQRSNIVVLREHPRGHYERYIYVSGTSSFGSTDMADVTASKSLEDDRIYQRYQFETYFRDTLVVWDTLKVKVIPTDFQLQNNPSPFIFNSEQPSLLFRYNTAKEVTIFMPDPKDILEKGKYLSCHYQFPGSIMMHCKLYFLSNQDKKEIVEVYHALHDGDIPGQPMDDTETNIALNAYIHQRWGIPRGWDIQTKIPL